MTEQELFQAARTNYEHLSKICERLELDGYWERPQKILKQPITMTLSIYVQSVLLLYTVYAKCLTPQMKLWLQKLTGADSIRVVDVETNGNILKLARKITYSPPILLQLCGVTDKDNHTEDACIFLDSVLNIILIFACQAESEVRDFTRFIQEYYQHVQVFLNQDTLNDKMNARYLFRKLSCERIEDSLCLYLEDKQRKERREKIKEDLKRLDLDGSERRKNYLSTGEKEEEKEDEEDDPLKVKVSSDGVVWEQEEEKEAEREKEKKETEKEAGKETDKKTDKETEKEAEKEANKRAEKETDKKTEAETEIKQETGEENGSILLEISEHTDLLEIVLKDPVFFEKSIYDKEVLNVRELSLNPKAGDWADITRLEWKPGREPAERDEEEKDEKEKEEEEKDKEEKNKEEVVREPEPIPDMADIKEGFRSLKTKMEAARNRELDSLLEELNSLIGLEAVKEEINSLINLIKVRKMREKYGMPTMDMTYHMVFTGSPGTGKTTVARLVAKIYKELGILSRGEVIETDRSGLVAGYIGQTAIKVKEVVESALGGVLFIDEAYALSSGRSEDFGSEVIDTLVKLMEDHRDDLVVIVAGYTKEMKEFLKSNSGLVSRFNKFIEFQDYTDTELLDILDSMAKKAGFRLEAGAREQIGGQLGFMTEQKKRDFGNARGIRNVFEKLVVNQANRLVGAENPTKEDLTSLLEEDALRLMW